MKLPQIKTPEVTIVREGAEEIGLEVRATGDALLRSPLTNKGTAFTATERAELGLAGLLPPRVETLDEQLARTYAAFQKATTPLERFRFLRRVQDTNEVLFYALLQRNLHEMVPVVYTPTVGEGVERFSDIYEEPRGMSLAIGDDPAAAVAAWPRDDVRMIVATDSSAILGIGDQGYNGMAIAIGKLALYTLAGAVGPFQVLPVVLDVGTDRAALHDDPAYLGLRRSRARGSEYLEYIRKFVAAVRARWPHAIIQWEDLGKDTALTVLDEFRETAPSFNDDVQGTGAVALAGLLTATQIKAGSGPHLAGERFLVFGAGAGGIGVARAIRGGLEREGLSRADATARVFVVDSKGLLVEGRAMEDYKKDFAQPKNLLAGWKTAGAVPTFIETITNGKVTALLGLSGQRGSFDEPVLRAVSANSDRPIVFALSNPTSACEALPADILRWTEGRAFVATGSPSEPVAIGDRLRTIGQGNNAFVFPGIGFGALLAGAKIVTDGMISEAAYALSELTMARWAKDGVVYPPIEALREVSIRVAARVARRAFADGVARNELPADLEALASRSAWSPRYVPFRRAST